MRMWDCSSSGCRIGCIGSGKCSIQTACIGAMTLAKATCSTAHQNLQVVASSSGSGTRTPAACPSTHNSAGCVCYSSTEGSCPAENYQVGKLTGSCSKNFGSASGTVTRLCTQAVGRLRVSIGNEITELDDLTAGYVYKSVAITSANTGNANMKFRELGGKPITLSVKDVTISDMVTGETTQSLLLDLANVCSGTRWEIELPAQQSGTPYTVKVTYGDQRMDMETSSCMLGTAGHMASVSAGTVAKGDFKTVQRSVFVPGNSAGVGNLVFSGEAASGCTGINKIEIAREDTVLWTDCGAPYSKGWNLKQSNSAPGNFQLVERAREGASNAKACVNPKSGKLVECAPESQVEEHIKQVFSLDYLAPLVAKWTQFESGQNLQPGSCVRARNQYLPNLKISSNQQDNHLVSCGTGQVLSSYLFKQDSSCNHVDDFRYFHSCTAIIPVTTTSSCVNLATRCVAHSNNHPHVWELDRHDVGAECAPGMLLTRFGYTSCSVEGGGGYQYTYTCCPVQGSGDCTEAYTEWGEVGQLSDLSALQHHHLQCPRDSGLKRFILEAQVPEVAADETLQGEVRYNFVCCKLPLAAPVSVRTGPLLAEDVQPWEGTYCPVGRTEGRPDFTRLAGSWPQMSVLKNTYCGYKKGLCSGDVMIGDDGGKWTSTARDLAGTICGAICAKHKDCQGLIATNSQGCAYRQHPHCWKEANSGIDCWVRINTSEMKIGFDRLGGSWCMTPEGGTAKCSSLTEVAHPLELLPNAGGVDYAPLVPMETDFEGNGATEVERDDMAQSLLGVSAAVSTRAGTNGGLGNQKFKKLPKIPKAKFQPAKFEMAEFKPFEGERKALERRGVTEHVLNWAPNAITYAPHCLARENREMILGAEPVDGAEHFLSSEERKKDVVGACYHALGVDGGGLSAVETWGEDATSDWTPPYPMDMMFSGHQGYPGLTADAVWECSTRDINRGYKLAMWERQADFNKAIIDLSGKPISKGICAAIPGTLSLVGAIAAYAGVKFETSKVCDAIAANIQGAATFMIEKRQSYREKRYIESDFQDCNPLQNTMAKVYCDLSCVEDAVKRGDEEILSSIGTLNRNILSEMKAFFDHYVSEIFTRLTHIEDKSSHESGQLKQVLDSYARAEIDAVNSNGKQIINAMNTQHSAMNRNLGNAAKQIFDLTHEEHKVLAATMNAHLQATSNAIDNLKAETQQGFHDAFNEFADTLSQEDLLELSKVSRSRRAALAQLNAWEDSVQSAGGQKLQQIEQALLVLQKRVQETPKEGNLTEHVMKMHEDVTSTVGELHELRKQPTAHESPAGTVDAEMKTLLSAAEKSLESHAMAAERMGRLIGALQSFDHLTSNAEDFHVEAQMVEFDKILVKIRGAAEEYLSESQEQAKLVREASKLTEQYLSKCTADFLELQLAAKKALQSGNKAARAARKAMKEVAQQVALLAEMLVDGGLARHALQRAAAQLAQRGATTAEDLEEVSDEPSSSHNMTSNAVELFQLLHAQRSASAPSTALELLASEEFHRALQMDLLANLRLRMPPVLPKALAAWRLFEDLQQRHAMHGLARVGSRDTELVRSAWERLDREVLLLASEIHVVASGLGEAWAARAQSMLEILAPVPARCQKLLPSSSGWMMWSNSTDGSSLLVRGATHLLQHHPKRHRVAHDFAQTTGDVEARICSHSASPSTLRAVHPGEAVLCFQRSPALKCTSWLTLESELDLWLM
ncbi:Uncharacterized protein SCF082_LOCUS46983 [Durusdinium trenchii]|uniref:Uncharacterized protein n=1 Tax=Durusdinium trenchii TaxID=1381693 RepID=A0ABP0RIE9_9DINO